VLLAGQKRPPTNSQFPRRALSFVQSLSVNFSYSRLGQRVNYRTGK